MCLKVNLEVFGLDFQKKMMIFGLDFQKIFGIIPLPYQTRGEQCIINDK